jgi:hypothetical protein
MSIFDSTKMSDDEWRFIRLYCAIIRREYELIQIIRALMRPNSLGLKCATQAVRLAGQLHGLQQEQCAKIEALGAKDGAGPAASKATTEQATIQEVASIFTLSFFKLVDGETKKIFLTDKGLPDHDGWTSGHPNDWQQSVAALQALHKAINTQPASLFMQAILKLFAASKNAKSNLFSGQANSAHAPDTDDEDDDEDDTDEDSDDLFLFLM